MVLVSTESVRFVPIGFFAVELLPHCLHELHPHFFHSKVRNGMALEERILFTLILRVEGVIMHFLPGIIYFCRQDVAEAIMLRRKKIGIEYQIVRILASFDEALLIFGSIRNSV